MRIILNVIWLAFGGIELFVLYVLAGLVSMLFIISPSPPRSPASGSLPT